jgi:hypothetical protein
VEEPHGLHNLFKLLSRDAIARAVPDRDHAHDGRLNLLEDTENDPELPATSAVEQLPEFSP